MLKNEILQGDALTKLKELESESIDSIITSPPYWALRDYKVDGQIGVEKTIDEYINNLINVFDEAKRVLKKSGTCWVVLGDTYSSQGGLSKPEHLLKANVGATKSGVQRGTRYFSQNLDVPDKSLCLIPERFAIKMIDNNWVLRNKIIWHKKNCMPSSAKDRFTVDYEYVYFFTKSQKYYFKTQYEKAISFGTRWGGEIFKPKKETSKYLQADDDGKIYALRTKNREQVNMYPTGDQRIKRCVWTINTTPLKEAHFAVFPEELVKQCLDAGCPSEGICLDPFMGSGTTALVALKYNRRFCGIELNPDYIKIANKRIEPYLKQEKLVFETRS